MPIFSEQTLRMLQNAGWSEFYRYDISKYEKVYERAGCAPPSKVKEFMLSFGGLYFTVPGPRSAKSVTGFDFNPVKVLQDIYVCSDYEFISEQVGLPVSPAYIIGSLHGIPAELLMVSDGKIYAYYDQILLKIGDSGEDAIEAMAIGRQFVKL
ncbi:MAG: SUKH-3 domain-containing protein [Chloroflexota bacterium]